MPEKTSIAELSIDSQLLAKLLREVEPNGVITYEQMNGQINRDCSPGGKAYGCLMTARRIVQREDQIVFDAVPNEGLKRLTNDDIARAGDGFVARIRRAARRGIRVLACVKFESLSNEDKIAHSASASQLGVLSEVAKASSTKRIASAVKESQEKLPVGKTLELFGVNEK